MPQAPTTTVFGSIVKSILDGPSVTCSAAACRSDATWEVTQDAGNDAVSYACDDDLAEVAREVENAEYDDDE